MNTKLILAIAAIATVGAALVGVAAAQFAASTTPFTNTVNRDVEPPCLTDDTSQIPECCVNATTGEPYCFQNGTQDAYGYTYGCGAGCYENGYANSYGYGYGCDEGYENQYPQRFGTGFMGRGGYGFGGCR